MEHAVARGFAEASAALLVSLQRKVAGKPPPFASTGPQGHRQRMRERLLDKGAASLADYELLEMLLFLGVPRIDTKPLAKGLINHFGSLSGVFTASPQALAEFPGLPPECVPLLLLPELAAERLAMAETQDRPVLGSWDRLHEYFDVAMKGAIPGQLRALYLDNRNRLLADEVIEQVAATQPDLPRLAMRRALELHATAMVLMRVLPPGQVARPSLAREAELAARIGRAATPLAVTLHDHLLIGGENWISLRQQGLL